MEILYMMKGSLTVLFLTGIYCLIRNNMFEITKYYLFLLFAYFIVIPLFIFLQNEEIGLDELINLLFYLIIILFLYASHKKDAQRKSIYKVLHTSSIYPIWVSGVNEIQLDQVHYFQGKLQNLFQDQVQLKGNVLTFISYDKTVLQLNFILLHPDDVFIFDRIQYDDGFEIVEKSQEGKGWSLVVRIAYHIMDKNIQGN